VFRDPEPCVRLAAAEVLAKRTDPALAPEFLGLLADSNFEVRLSAVQFLGRIRDPEIAQALLPFLADADSDVRAGCSPGSGHDRRAGGFIQALVLALTDEDAPSGTPPSWPSAASTRIGRVRRRRRAPRRSLRRR
jgi:HEAT repeat protein